jgi:hypothetical protein
MVMDMNSAASIKEHSPLTVSQAEQLVENFKTLYCEMCAQDLHLPLLQQVYAENMAFHDSFHCIEGREAFIHYCENLYENLQRCDFYFHEHWISEGQAIMTWTMTYQHPRLNRGKPVDVEGATHIRFQDKVTYHRDYCDGGALLYEHIPLLGTVIQQLKKRLV